MIKVSVLGATGYAGIELVRLLSTHKYAQIKYIGSKSFSGKKVSEIYPNFNKILDKELTDAEIKEVAKESDVVFTALPHGTSKEVIPKLFKHGVKIIDLSGDFRYDDPTVYEKWYGEPHSDVELLKESVYGLCEIHREKIKNARIIGNPGCYTTCSILGALPLVKYDLIDKSTIIIDAKSGVSGAGRSTSLDTSFCECTENMKAYKIATHRHTSEIEQELSNIAGSEITLSFTPHLIPLKRGILATIYANLKTDLSAEEILSLYKECYKNEYFIRMLENRLPETKFVSGSNFVDIGLKVDKRLNRIIVCSTLDNLIKGAAGQAVQNMNIMFDIDEKEGLDYPGYYI